MPQPVQPPEIPAIIQTVASESSQAKSASLSSQTPLNPPERFPPESSLLKATKSAALLGPRISVGESLKPAAAQQEESLNSITTSPSSPDTSSQSGENLVTVNLPELVASNSESITLGMKNVKRLLTQERGGEVKEFELTIPTQETQSPQEEKVAPPPSKDETVPKPPTTPNPATPPAAAPTSISGVIELVADRQEYNEQQQVVTATGKVSLRFREALLEADRVSINLPNRIVVAEGNVSLTRGQQVMRGQRFEYSLVQDSGVIFNASGEFYTPTAGTDFDILSPSGTVGRPLSNRIVSDRPLQGVTNAGGYSFVIGAGRNIENGAAPQSGGTINRVRYQAERVDFDGKGGIATNVRITNDPFSPPELELRADKARFTRLEPLVDEVVATRPRLVFDQGLELPVFPNRLTLDRRQRDPSPFNIGYDGGDRGGVFIERRFDIINNPSVRFSVTPQYFIQKATIGGGGIIDPSVFGFKTQLNATINSRTTLTGRTVLTTLDPDNFENQLRASLRLKHIIGTTLPHILNVEYSYRDRLFNGSLGFQTVQSSLGAVVTSPVIPLGNTGVNLSYQAGAAYINADTDRIDLLDAVRTNDRVSLGRLQASATLSKGFTLWRGKGLPATPTEGLRYTPTPVVPYLQLNTVLSGVGSAYSNGDTQESLSGTVGIVGQVGHFSKKFLDYTGFNLSYTQVARGNLSPFLFDRVADTSVLSGGITQQVYGPFRAGFQTALNLNTRQEISTDYFVEYSRRSYSILLRYNPKLELGSISLRISDFNWGGNPGPFDETRNVIQGVKREE
ncbi:MAG: DUF3769 domain-containing protein [Potamolinea sp.]